MSIPKRIRLTDRLMSRELDAWRAEIDRLKGGDYE
jgi:hypothetical protein